MARNDLVRGNLDSDGSSRFGKRNNSQHCWKRKGSARANLNKEKLTEDDRSTVHWQNWTWMGVVEVQQMVAWWVYDGRREWNDLDTKQGARSTQVFSAVWTKGDDDVGRRISTTGNGDGEDRRRPTAVARVSFGWRRWWIVIFMHLEALFKIIVTLLLLLLYFSFCLFLKKIKSNLLSLLIKTLPSNHLIHSLFPYIPII